MTDEDLKVFKYLQAFVKYVVIPREVVRYITTTHFATRGIEFHFQLNFQFDEDAAGDCCYGSRNQVKEQPTWQKKC